MAIIAQNNSGTTAVSAINATQIQGIDVSVVAPTDGQTLVYDLASDSYIPETIVGGGSTAWADITGKPAQITALSGTNTGDQTNITGNAATVTTNANLTGVVTSTGNATSIANGAISNAMLANSAVANLSGTNTGDQDLSGKANTTHTHTAADISDFDTEVANNSAVTANTAKISFDATSSARLANTSGTNTGDQTNITGNAATVTTNANLTGVVTSTGNATAIANGAITNAMLANSAVANLSGTNTGDQDLSTLLVKASNLSDLTNATTARTNLGLGSLATQSGTFSGTSSGTNTGDQTDAQALSLAKLESPSFYTVQHLQDVFHSSGWTSGGVITDGGSGTINVTAGTGLIRATDSDTATLYFCKFDAKTALALTNNSANYIYCEYNAGSPQIIATATERTDYNSNFIIGTVYRDGTTLHINQKVKAAVSDHAGKMIRFNMDVMPYAKTSGGMVMASGTRGFMVTAGSYWHGLIKFATDAFDTAMSGTFSAHYRNGSGGWTKQTAQTQINNTQYDNNSGTLATLTNNKYGVHWIYQAVDNHIDCVFGQGDYTLTEAQDATAPATLPPTLPFESFLIAKIIIQKNAAAFTQILSASHSAFSASVVADHNNLAGLQGGTVSEYYHLTSAQATVATQAASGSVNGYLSSANWTTFNGKQDALPLTTNGDTLYYNAGLQRLAKGTDGQVLTLASGVPSWATAAGGSSNLVMTTISATSTITLTLAGADTGTKVTLGASNATATFVVTASSLVSGALYYIELDITQDGTGGRTLTFAANTGATLKMPITSPPISATATTGRTRITIEAYATSTSAADFSIKDLRVIV